MGRFKQWPDAALPPSLLILSPKLRESHSWPYGKQSQALWEEGVFKSVYLKYTYECMSVYGQRPKVLDLPGAGVIHCPVWILGPELGSSGKTVHSFFWGGGAV